MGKRLLVIALVASSLAGGCASRRPGIVVGAVYPTSGNQGPEGLDEWRGVELAADRVNADGGVNGRSVQLKLQRTDSGEAAPAAVERLKAVGAEVVVGSYGSTISAPAARAAVRRGLVFWETGAVGELGMTAPASGRVFRFPPSGIVLGSKAISFVEERVHPDAALKWAVVHVDDVYGRAVAQGAIDQIKGDAVVLPYSVRDADYDAIAGRVEASGADALFVSAYLDDGVALRRAVVERGLELKAVIGTSSSYCHPAFGRALGPDAVGVFASDKPDGDVVAVDALRPEAAELLRWARDAYRERHGEPMSAAALSGFSGAWALFSHVLPRARSAKAPDVAAAAAKARIPVGGLPNGSGLAFEGAENVRAASVVWQWVESGRREVVWPSAFATHEMIAPAG